MENIKTAQDLQDYLRSLCVVAEPSVDKIIIGDPAIVIKKVATCWLAYFDTIKEAYEDGVNVIITHEPTFYTHNDLDEHYRAFDYDEYGREMYEKQVKEKADWILKHHMVIIRCHDVMDEKADFGMPFALGQKMGFSNEDIIRKETFYNVYGVKPDKAIDAAKKIINNLSDISSGAAFYGDENRVITSIGVGTGCFCDPIGFMKMNADMYIAIDDSIRTWVQTAYSKDTGLPMLVINHGTSEENGMKLLCDELNQKIDTTCIHYQQGCTYNWINCDR